MKCQRPGEDCTKNLGDTFLCRHALTSEKNLVFLKKVVPALIGNSNNIEIRLVVSGILRGILDESSFKT